MFEHWHKHLNKLLFILQTIPVQSINSQSNNEENQDSWYMEAKKISKNIRNMIEIVSTYIKIQMQSQNSSNNLTKKEVIEEEIFSGEPSQINNNNNNYNLFLDVDEDQFKNEENRTIKSSQKRLEKQMLHLAHLTLKSNESTL